MMSSPITYEIRKITEKYMNNKTKRVVTVVLEKVMKLNGHLLPMVTTLKVFYPVWDDEHMVSLVNTLPPCSPLDNLERIKVAKVLKSFCQGA